MKNIINKVSESVNSAKEITISTLQSTLLLVLGAIRRIDFGALKGSDKDVTAVDKYVLTIDNLLKVAQQNGRPIKTESGRVYIYNGSYWEYVDYGQCTNFLGRVAIASGYDSTTGKFYHTKKRLYEQLLTESYTHTVQQDSKYTYLNLKNGTLRVSADGGVEFLKHESKHNLHYCMDFAYDKEATCPLFNAFLNQVLPDAESRQLLQDYLGYIFVKNLKIEKILILYGGGANGKSVVYEIVRRLLGADNITSYSLSELTKDEKCRANIEHKLLNFASEISGDVKSDILKRMASGEPIPVRRLYQEPREMTNYPKMMFVLPNKFWRVS